MSYRRTAVVLALVMIVPILLPFVPTAAAASFGAGTPTFIHYAGPTGLSASSAEPTIGINWNTGAVLMTVENFVPLNLPPSMKVASVNFDDSVFPPTAAWIDATNGTPGRHGNVDPILFTDSVTGRTWAGGLDGACSVLGMTDNDGVSWQPVGNSCAATLDHETIGSGPYAQPAPPSAIYPRAVYYCAQASAVSCAVSYDGGLTFPITAPVTCGFTNPGLHGSVHVGANGHAWLPFKNGQGQTCVARSRDNGLSWTGIKIPGTTSPGAGFDPDVATTTNNWVYVGLPHGGPGGTSQARVALSKDDGATWTLSPDLGAAHGLKVTTFHEMVAGDDQRAALAFLGSTTGSVSNAFSSASFSGVWHLYVAYTYDGGQTWTTIKTSDDPVQRGCIWDSGGSNPCRNLLDFMDAQVDKEGRVLVGFADGCTSTACKGPTGTPSQSRDKKATIARQTTGKGLFAAYDGGSISLDPVTGIEGQPATLAGVVTLAAPYSLTVNWGDGTIDTFSGQTSAAFSAQHVYATDGQYTISVSGQGADSDTAVATTQASIADDGGTGGAIQILSPGDDDVVGDLVTVTGIVDSNGNTAPVAAFSFAVSGLHASFDASASSDADLDPLTYSWTFGDGAIGVGQFPEHDYASPGTYPVCLTVSDGSLTGSVCHDVTLTASGTTTLGTDPEGDAASPIPVNGNVDDMDLLKLEATTSANGEPVFLLTLKTLGTPDHHATHGGDGAQWQVEWNGPMGLDFVSLNAALTAYSCQWGFFDPDLEFYSGQGATTCSVTPGTPGTITITYPQTGMGTRGYTGSDTLSSVKATTAIYQGTPQDIPVWAGGTTPVDEMGGTDFTNDGFASIGRLGLVSHRAAQPAPTAPPADPHIVDTRPTDAGDLVPQTNVQSAWFDSDANYLYVGLKLEDVPTDFRTTTSIRYTVGFVPSWTPGDTSWNGAVPSGNTFTGLRAMAVYTPVSAANGVATNEATTFELQALSTSAAQNNFGTVATVTGSVDPSTDIIWWAIPRVALQDPAGGAILSNTNAGSGLLIAGIQGINGVDATGNGREYTFPTTQVTPPTVTLDATPASGVAPLAVSFAGTVTPNNVATWRLDFGDGTPDATGTGALAASIPHVYENAGSYTATLTVTAPNGGIGTAQATVTAGSSPVPTRVIVSAPGAAPVEATCQDGCATWSAQLDLSALSVGDVTITASLQIDGETRSTDSVVVTLQREVGVVIDLPGQDSTVEAGDVRVAGRLAGASNLPPVAELSADAGEGVAPFEVQFTLRGTDDHGVTSYRFTTGDGRVVDGTTLPTVVTHTYENAGEHTASLTVRDASGATDTESLIIRVQATNSPPTPPANPSPADGAGSVALPVTLTWDSTDPDGNTLSFDVYLDTGDASTLVATGQTAAFMPANLADATTYVWRVVASDGIAQTAGPVWSFTTAPGGSTEAEKPHVVVAVIDSGTNPYHTQFRRANLVDHPSTYLSGFPANAVEIDLCFYDKITKTVDQTRCPGSANAAADADAAEWAKLTATPISQTGAGQGTVGWFPGTNIMIVSFGHSGTSGFNGLDGAKGAGDSHGTATSSNVNGLTTGACPECIVVMVENDGSLPAAYKWAANQPWIDVISSSVRGGVAGQSPGDALGDTALAVKTAVASGKIVVESSGNGVGNAGVAPTTTYTNPHGNPWTIPVGCSRELTGQVCQYHDFPNAITASGILRQTASVDSFSGTATAGGTSFSTPSSAGVIGRALLAARTAMNDVTEGPSTSGTKSLVRVGPGATAPATGPFADGSLTRLELEEVLFKTARRALVPVTPRPTAPAFEIPNTPVNFVKEGYGNVYSGDWGVGHPTAQTTWSSAADMTAVILGQKDVPQRWLEETWWEEFVEPLQEEIYGDTEIGDTDADAFPRDDPQDTTNLGGYSPSMMPVSPSLPTNRAAVPSGSVPTATANRLYLHHNNQGPDPASPINDLIEYYMNSIPDPTGGQSPCNDETCADQTGLGGTGIGTAGGSNAYVLSHPTLGAPLLLDTTKDVVVHVEAGDFVGGPASPLSLLVTLTSGETLVGQASAPNLPGATGSVYEARFKPLVGAVSDPVTLTVAWEGPTYSIHIDSKGASWMDLPVQAALPPLTYEPVTYFVDDLALATTNGATVTLTRDFSKLIGDADKNSIFTAPQAFGVTYNLQAEDFLVTDDALLSGAGMASLYVCTASVDAGAAIVTAKVALAIDGVPIGGGSATKQLVGPNDGRTVPLPIPLSLAPHLLAKGKALTGAIKLEGPAGVFAYNTGVCGGSANMPWSITLGIASLDAVPSATIGTIPAVLTGTKAITGTADFPPAPAVAKATWYATDFDDWDSTHQTLTMDTTGPGTGSGGPILEPSPDGLVLTFRSARPAAQDAPVLAANGVGTAQFWVTAIGGATDVTVDFTVLLEKPTGAQRLLGEGSVTKHLVPPLGTVSALWHDSFLVGFTPKVTDPQADETLVMIVNVHNAGPASTSHISCLCGGPDRPIYVSLPRDVSADPASPVVDVVLDEFLATVPVVNGAWTVNVDTRTLPNGDHTLRVTPRALYGGVTRTGEAETKTVTINNVGINTPPTASLGIAPSSGFAPLAVVAGIGGSDAETNAALLSWRIAWGDGTPAATGVGLPATASHTYAVGSYTATLTVTDAGGMIATATAPVQAFEAPPVEKVIVILDGGAPVDATDTSGDGSFATWETTLDIQDAGFHSVTARHMRGDDIVSEASVSFQVHVPNLPTIDITTPLDGSVVDAGQTLSGTAEAPGPIVSVVASIDDFATSVAAQSGDGFATWSVDLDALGLPEDVETLVKARATTDEGSSTDAVSLTLNAAPNPRIDVLTALPVQTQTDVEFQASGTPAASGAGIVAWSWTFGDGDGSTQTHPTHAYARSGTYTVALTVTDANGRSGTTSRDVLITNRLPVVDLDVSPTDPTTLDTVTLTATATDAEGTIESLTTTAYAGTTRQSGVLETGGATLSLQFPDDGTYLLVARAVDDEGGASETETLLVVHNVRPIADLTASPLLVGQGNEVTFDASGSSDPDGSVVEYRFDVGDGTPVVVTTNPVVRHAYGASGVYDARVTVVDDDGSAITSDAIAITVNARPVLAPIGNKVVAEGATLSFTVSATDEENDAITYGADPLPAGASFDTTTGAFTWTTTYDDEGNYPITFSATDGHSTDTETIYVSVGNVNLPPVLRPIGAKDGLEATLLTFQVIADDPDTALLNYSATGLPSGAAFSTSTGVFTWTPSYTQAGSYQVRFGVNDGVTSLFEDVTITIQNNDRAPILQPIAAASLYQLSQIKIPLVASDPDNDPITYAVSGAPGATIVPDYAGRPHVHWTPSIAILGPQTVTVYAMSNDLSASQSAIITVLFKTDVSVTHASPNQVETSPGAVVPVTARVTNTGPQVDTFTISAVNTAGWTLGSIPDPVTLAPGEFAEVTVDVTVPADSARSLTTIYATSVGDGGTTVRSTRFTIEVPVEYGLIVFEKLGNVSDVPRGIIQVKHKDGTPAVGAEISITQMQVQLQGNSRTSQAGLANENGLFFFDFTRDAKAMIPGDHQVVITAKKTGGPENVRVTQYKIGSVPNLV